MRLSFLHGHPAQGPVRPGLVLDAVDLIIGVKHITAADTGTAEVHLIIAGQCSRCHHRDAVDQLD